MLMLSAHHQNYVGLCIVLQGVTNVNVNMKNEYKHTTKTKVIVE
jgi:hypothetical protein